MANRKNSFWKRLVSFVNPKQARRNEFVGACPRKRSLHMEPLEERCLLTSVGVATLDSVASEGVDANYAVWQISRSGDTDASCSVAFRLTGTATTAGRDRAAPGSRYRAQRAISAPVGRLSDFEIRTGSSR